MKAMDQNPVLLALRQRGAEALSDFVRNRRWFAGKARTIDAITIADVIPLGTSLLEGYLVLARVAYTSGLPEIYDIPLMARAGPGVSGKAAPGFEIHLPDRDLAFSDALSDAGFLELLLDAIAYNRRFAGANGEVRARAANFLRTTWDPTTGGLTPVLNRGEQSNSSIMYGKRLILKLLRRIEEGVSPDIEVGSFLTEKTSFKNIAPVAGCLEYAGKDGAQISLGILQGFVANRGDAWEFTLQQISEYYRADGLAAPARNDPFGRPEPLLEVARRPLPAEARARIGQYLDWAELLGRRTAELHLALGSPTNNPEFAAEPFTAVERRAFAEAAERLLTSTFETLRRQLGVLEIGLGEPARKVLSQEKHLRERLLQFERMPISAQRTRIHGDYHLGQVLFTGQDFVIIDFEGEPSRPLAERRKKRSPLQDVAGMLRSFHYAASAPLLGTEPQDRPGGLEDRAAYWQKWVSAAFLRKYLEAAGKAAFIPASPTELALMLDIYLLDKAVYELGYELNNRPTWVRTPLEGISQLLAGVVEGSV